ncbi:MAG: response regulator, partial [Planctomycetes bacterium]|nr:response regulator [Planctomycetota bacterium]
PRVDEKAEKRDTDKITEEMPMGTETILLVEDEEGVRKLVSRTLRKKGYTVLEATNGEDALVVAGKHDSTIQLVLSDVVMPKMSGPDLAQKFHETRPATKFVFMSGYTEHAIIRHGMIDGGIAFLNKPCPPDELLKKIREVLGA